MRGQYTPTAEMAAGDAEVNTGVRGLRLLLMAAIDEMVIITTRREMVAWRGTATERKEGYIAIGAVTLLFGQE